MFGSSRFRKKANEEFATQVNPPRGRKDRNDGNRDKKHQRNHVPQFHILHVPIFLTKLTEKIVAYYMMKVNDSIVRQIKMVE